VASYKGKYKVKNRKKYRGDPDNVIYRSMWERRCFVWLDNNPSIVEWSSEEVCVPYIYEVDKKYHRYFVDLMFTTVAGHTFLIEVKPEKETQPPKKPDKSKRYLSESLTYVKNVNKWHAAQQYATNKGWTFQVWTEKHLMQYGIMPKVSKNPLPKMQKLKPISTKKKKK